MNMLLTVLLLLAASCTVPVAGAGAKGRELPGANSFLRTGQTLPTGRQGAGMVMLKSNIVVFGGVSGGGACGTAKRGARRGRERRCALSMPTGCLAVVCLEPGTAERGASRGPERRCALSMPLLRPSDVSLMFVCALFCRAEFKDDIHIFNIAEDFWRMVEVISGNPSPPARAYMGFAVADSRADRAYMFGGLGGECLPSR